MWSHRNMVNSELPTQKAFFQSKRKQTHIAFIMQSRKKFTNFGSNYVKLVTKLFNFFLLTTNSADNE